MTAQDIEKLKAFCEKEGLYFDFDEVDGTALIVRDRDEWEGVGYAISDHNGHIYKIDRFETSPMKKIWFSHGKFLFPEKCKPSTESAYVDQLKTKAHELYGDIKNGDRFWIDENLGEVSMYDCEDGFSYRKEEDLLYFGNYAIYSKGKWAKRVEEPIKANITSFTLSNPYSTIVFTTSHRIKDGQVDVKEFMNHIEESIEAFLNRKP